MPHFYQISDYSDKRIDYSDKVSRFFLSLISLFFITGIIFSEQEVNITSDKMVYDKSTNKAFFSGNVKLKTGDVSLECKSAKLDITKGDVYLRSVYFTTCNLENPHYRYYSKKVHLVLDKWVTAVPAVFFADDVPVGIHPYYYRSLRDKRLRVEFTHGYSKNEDYYTNGLIGYMFSDYFQSKFYIDYYSYKGWGKGTEAIYVVPGQVDGTVYGYLINENDTHEKRWNARMDHWQNLSRNWIAQINSNISSDESFNDKYTYDWTKIERDVNSSVAFTKTLPQSTARLYFSRYDVFESSINKYILTDLTAPSVSYETTKIRIQELPLYYEFGVRGERTWTKSSDFYLTQGNSNLDITNPLRLTRKITLTSAAGFTQYWEDRKDKDDKEDIFRGVYRTDLNVRINSLSFLSHEFGHHFEQELYKKKDDYHGVLVNKLRTMQSAYLDNLTLRFWTGLDIRRKLDEKITVYRERLDDLTSEAEYDIYGFLNLYYRNEYSVVYKRPTSARFESKIKFKPDRYAEGEGSEVTYLKNGVSYQRTVPDYLTSFAEAGIRPTKNWQFAFKTQFSFNYLNFSDFKYYEHSVNLHRDIHCWEAIFSYIDRSDEYEFWFRIRVKPPALDKKEKRFDELERKWYPWREKGQW